MYIYSSTRRLVLVILVLYIVLQYGTIYTILIVLVLYIVLQCIIIYNVLCILCTVYIIL